MSLKTTPPVDGTIASAALWGQAVYGDLAAITNIGAMVNQAPSSNFGASATFFQNIAGWVLNQPKTSDTSKMLVLVMMTGYATSITSFVQTIWSIGVDGVDYPCAFYNWNTATDHRQVVGGVIIPGLLAGVKSMAIRGRVSGSGGGTPSFNHDSNDRASIISFEMP